MAIKAYVDMEDNRIAAYRPVSARMITRMRNNILATCGELVLVNNIGDVGTDNGTVAWVTVGTVPLFVPAHSVGAGGTKITLWLQVTLTGAAGAEPEAKGRLKVGAVTGTESSEFATPLPVDISLPSATINTIYDVEIEAWVNDATNTATVKWQSADTGTIERIE